MDDDTTGTTYEAVRRLNVFEARQELVRALEQVEQLRRRLAVGARFLEVFDSIMADETDGTYRLYSDTALHSAASRFRISLRPPAS